MCNGCGVLAQESFRAQCMCLHTCWIRIEIGQCASDATQCRQPCAVYAHQSSGTVFMSAVVVQNMRRHSLLRWYGDHSRMSYMWTAYSPRKLGAVGISTAYLPRCYCVWYARRSHGDFQNLTAHIAHVAYAWRTSATPLRTFGVATAYVKILGRMCVSTAYLQFFSYAVQAQ